LHGKPEFAVSAIELQKVCHQLSPDWEELLSHTKVQFMNCSICGEPMKPVQQIGTGSVLDRKCVTELCGVPDAPAQFLA
jgi:hypothetical protein